jgi:amidase
MEPGIIETLLAALPALRDLGCTVEEATPDLRDTDEIFETLRAWHFELSYGELLRDKRASVKQTVAWNVEEGEKLSGSDVGRAERKRTELFHRMRAFFTKYDFLVCPVTQVLPFDVNVEYPMEVGGRKMGSYLEWMRSCYRISATGLPALSVPAGFSAGGLPVGLQIVGPHLDDFGVLQLGHAFERAAGFSTRRAPAAC